MIFIFIFSFFCWVTGCATITKLRPLAILPDFRPVKIELHPKVGQWDRTEYRSRTLTETYSNGEITKRLSEGVDFGVEMKVMEIDAQKKHGVYRLTTVQKDGKSDLADFAVPELGESMDYVLNHQAQVVRAGEMPPGTIYFVPPVSLPQSEVRVGDTWPLSTQWISLKTGMALRMDIASVFKAVRDCGQAGPCAEIEISGDVGLAGKTVNPLSSQVRNEDEMPVRLQSDLKGRIIVSLNKGSVLYSYVRSNETMYGGEESIKTSSCMLSYVVEPASDFILKTGGTGCDPTSPVPEF